MNSRHRLQVAEDSRQVADEADGEDDRRRAVEEDAVLEAGVAAAGASSVIRDDKDKDKDKRVVNYSHINERSTYQAQVYFFLCLF